MVARSHALRASLWASIFTLALAVLIIVGSRRLANFDAALVGYTFATLFATFGITYRYAMWLQRPPTRMYWKRGWQAFVSPRFLAGNLGRFVQRAVVEVAGNRFIFRRSALRGLTHWLLMWGCIIAAAITFPLVFGWIHFETVPGHLDTYRTYVFGFAAGDFPVASWLAFMVFHGLVWASFLVLAGVMLAFRRRMIDHGAMAAQQQVLAGHEPRASDLSLARGEVAVPEEREPFRQRRWPGQHLPKPPFAKLDAAFPLATLVGLAFGDRHRLHLAGRRVRLVCPGGQRRRGRGNEPLEQAVHRFFAGEAREGRYLARWRAEPGSREQVASGLLAEGGVLRASLHSGPPGPGGDEPAKARVALGRRRLRRDGPARNRA